MKAGPQECLQRNLESTIRPLFAIFKSLERCGKGVKKKASVASTQTVDSQTRLIKVVHFAYRKWAYFIVSHSWSVIFLCSLVTAICSVKVVLTPNENDITGYTPYGARSREELAIREQFFGNGHTGASFGAFILVAPKNGGNLLDVDLLKQIIEIDDIVRDNISLYNHITHQNESFGQFCKDFCDLNQPVRTFYSALEYQTERLRLNESLHSRIQLAYPVTNVYGRKLNIQPILWHFFLTPKILPKKPCKSERVGEWSDAEVRDYEMSISNYFENKYHSDKVKVMSISTTYVTNEVVRAGMSMVPFLGLGFDYGHLLVLHSAPLSCLYGTVSVHKITLAFMACVCPFMACGTALGLLLFGGSDMALFCV
uniref:Patched domain-containing protein 3 n=1 Tax=Ditylenchus dipsaci TaxID=166011 RepID=A0A915DKX1_9BILA